jgi:DNA invertase Pin-like site-specific DNA recombinase
VLVTKLDRAFRNAKDTYDNLAYLDQHQVGFIATTQPIDTSTSTGKLLLGVLAAVAEFERELIRERTIEGLNRARAEGNTLVGLMARRTNGAVKKGGTFCGGRTGVMAPPNQPSKLGNPFSGWLTG